MTTGHTFEKLSIDSIGELKPEDYVGMIDDAAVACLKARLAVEPLHTPIWVRRNGNAAKGKPFSVIAGRHRLRAAIALGWREIAAEVRAGPDSKPEELRRLQLAENLDRRVLRPIERACFIMERWRDAAQQLPATSPKNQQAKAAEKRWLSALATVANAPKADRDAIDEMTATTTGDKPRTVRRYRRIFENLVAALPDQYAQINAHPLGESLSAMMSLAQVRAADTRRAAADMLLSRTDWPNITAVLVAAGVQGSPGFRVDPTLPDPVFNNAWMKMSRTQKRVNALYIAKWATPGLAREMFEVLKAKLP